MHQIAPVPNHNGSPADDLAKQMMEVSNALEAARRVMSKWCPHGRDYQIGGDYQADRAECMRRLHVITELVDQYEKEAIAVSEYTERKLSGV